MRTNPRPEGPILSESYDSAEDPSKLKFWWEAGVRDGDPVETPPLMLGPSPSLSSVSEAPQADSTRDVASHQMLASGNSGGRLSGSHHGRDSDVIRDQPRQSEIEWAPSNISEESVELGREIASSLSTKSALYRKRYSKDSPLRTVDEADHYASLDVTGGGPRLLEPAELLQETPSQLTFRVSWNASCELSRRSSFFRLLRPHMQEWDTDVLLADSSGSRKRPDSNASSFYASLLSSQTSMNEPGGILAPDKRTDSKHISREYPLGVNPSALRISVGLAEVDCLCVC